MLHIDNLQLKMAVECIIDNGGEGVILRQAGSLYESGRSPFLIKLKVSPFILLPFMFFTLICCCLLDFLRGC